LTVNTGVAAGGAKTTITAGTSTSIDAITASGTGAFEITALTASSLDAINAGGVTGAVTLGSSSAALTMASGASITTGTGNDSITMSAANALVIDAGGNTSSGKDTLVLVGTQNGGTGVINLAASGDQLTQLNGVAEGVVQSGFESVNVSAVTSTGSNGFLITANAAGSTIVGSGYNDTIFGGAGVDVFFGGAGNDTITGGGGADVFHFNGGVDTVTDFAAGAGGDVIDISSTGNSVTTAVLLVASGTADPKPAAASGVTSLAIADGTVLTATHATYTSFDTASEILTLFDSGATFDAVGNGEEHTLLIAFTDTGKTHVWDIDHNGTSVTATEVAVLESFPAADLTLLTAANFQV
jgi:Ca2+-binding RTX toxin-like protein